jgi:hypothetical protein
VNDLEGLSNRAIDLLDRRGADAAHTLRSAHLSPPGFDPGRRLPPSGLGVGLMAAMVALVAMAGAMVVAANRDGEPQVGDIAGPVGELAPLVPTFLPDGLVLEDALGGPGSPPASDGVARVAVFGIATAADPHDGPTFTLATGRSADGGPDFDTIGGQVDILGVEAHVVDLPGRPMLAWDRAGAWFQLTGRWSTVDDLVGVAERLVVDPADDLSDIGWRLLDGTEVQIGDALGAALFYRDRRGGAAAVTLSWGLRGDLAFDALRALQPGDPECPEQSLALCGGREIELRGARALVAPQRSATLSGHHVSWIEPDGREVRIEAWGIDVADLVRLAEGLRLGTWDELDPAGPPAPDPPTAPTTVAAIDQINVPEGHPGRDVEVARALVGNPRLQLRAVVESRGERNQAWVGVSPAAMPFDESVTLLGVAVDGWYPGTHELGPGLLDGTMVTDAHPMPAPTNAFAVRGDRLWLQFSPDVRAALDELVRVCAGRAAACPTGRVALVFQDEVVGIVGLSALGETGSITVEVGSWGRNRAPG